METNAVIGDAGMRLLEDLSKEELIRIILDDAKNWLAHDGLWFQAIEKMHGMEVAINADREAWRHFTVIEAKRIMERLGIKPGGGIPALVECLKHRLYARLNLQEAIEQAENRVVFRMLDCRVQSARRRKGLDDFPCKRVGVVEYAEFAKAVDPRIKTTCIACPPDKHPDSYWCAWEFCSRGKKELNKAIPPVPPLSRGGREVGLLSLGDDAFRRRCPLGDDAH